MAVIGSVAYFNLLYLSLFANHLGTQMLLLKKVTTTLTLKYRRNKFIFHGGLTVSPFFFNALACVWAVLHTY